ncbi:hypothetical protein AB0O31_22425, partial [Kitasatospora cineracea]
PNHPDRPPQRCLTPPPPPATPPRPHFHRTELDELLTALRPIATACRADLPPTTPIGLPNAA